MSATTSGDLTETIRVWSNAYTRAADGQKTEAPSLYVKRYAKVRAIAGSEKRVGQQLAADIDYTVTVRSDGVTRGITPRHWLTWGEKRLDVVSAYDPDGGREWVELACKERVT